MATARAARQAALEKEDAFSAEERMILHPLNHAQVAAVLFVPPARLNTNYR